MRISTWYWLNTMPENYLEDFQRMRDMGCDNVCMGFGLNLSMIAEQIEMTHHALDCCTSAGLTATLLIYNPTSMGEVKPCFQACLSNGKQDTRRANVYNQAWIQEIWRPYLEKVATQYGAHPALRAYMLDDTFSCGNGTIYSYTANELARFRQYVAERYQDIARVNDLWRCKTKLTSWDGIELPVDPVAQTGAWADWTDARRQWVREWASETVAALHRRDASHPVIYTDYDYYWRRSIIAHGADLSDMAAIFDEYGLYEAMPKSSMRSEAICHNWKMELEAARAYVPAKPMHAILWMTDVYTFEPIEEETLRRMMQTSRDLGAVECQLYAYLASDWTRQESFQPPYTHLKIPHKLSLALYPDRIRMLGRVIRAIR